MADYELPRPLECSAAQKRDKFDLKEKPLSVASAAQLQKGNVNSS